MIDKLQIQDTKANFDLLSYAGQHSELRKVAAKEWAGPCPMCGGNDRFRVRADGWFCRHCKNEPWQDAYTLVMAVENCTFADALARMTGNAFALPPERRQPATKAKAAQVAGWADKAAAMLQAAQEALYSENDTRGADYLLGREITPDAWLAFGLGYKPDAWLPGTWNDETKERTYPTQPAILMPWYAGGRLVAIRYRFLQSHSYIDARGKEQTNKQGAMFGSTFEGRLFGGQCLARCAEDLRTLVICEGELNAISVWQIASETKVDVLSLGSESQHLTPAMVDYARRFKHIIVWADRPEVAKNLMAALPGAYGISSPDGQDANDLLRAGHLGGYLSAWRFQMCQSESDRKALYYNLIDAANTRLGIDDGSRQVMATIGKALMPA